MAPDGRPAHGAPAAHVRDAVGADDRAWDAYVDAHPDATFFHLSGWRGLIERVFRHRCHYLVAERDGRLTGVLPLAEVRSRLFGHALVSLPFAVYGGPLADDAATARALAEAAADIARRLQVGHLELRNRVACCDGWPQQDLYVTFRREILPDVEANLNAIPRKQRAMVRKGIKNGLSASTDATPDRFFALYADNMHRHGTPAFGPAYFRALADVFGERCEFLVVADAAGAPVSGVCSFYFRDEVLPYYAGDVTAARDLAANDFKYWELMRRACERGLRVFDYGRSKKGTGSFDFKKNWGFVPTPLAYEYALVKRTAIPQNNPLNPKYRAMIATWRRLPRPLVGVLGPMLVKSLG